MEAGGHIHAPAALPQDPLDRMPGGLQSRSERGGEEKNFQPLLEIKPRSSSP